MYIKDRPEDFPVLDKIKLKRIQVSIETWENICDLVESIIKDGLVDCKRKWFSSKNLLCFLNLPLLDLINEALPLKLQLEKIKIKFTKSKERIQDIIQVDLDHIKERIEAPVTSLMKTHLFLWEWENIKKREITSLIWKVELHLEHAQYRDIQDLLDAFSKWNFSLGKS